MAIGPRRSRGPKWSTYGLGSIQDECSPHLTARDKWDKLRHILISDNIDINDLAGRSHVDIDKLYDYMSYQAIPNKRVRERIEYCVNNMDLKFPIELQKRRVRKTRRKKTKWERKKWEKNEWRRNKQELKPKKNYKVLVGILVREPGLIEPGSVKPNKEGDRKAKRHRQEKAREITVNKIPNPNLNFSEYRKVGGKHLPVIGLLDFDNIRGAQSIQELEQLLIDLYKLNGIIHKLYLQKVWKLISVDNTVIN